MKLLKVNVVSALILGLSGSSALAFHRTEFPLNLNNEASVARLADLKNDSQKIEAEEIAYAEKSENSLSVKLKPLKQRISPIELKSDGFTVQVSSVTQETALNEKLKLLKAKKINDVWVMTAVVSGQKRLRVCSGRFDTKEAAVAAKLQIAQNAEFKDAFVQKAPARLSAADE